MKLLKYLLRRSALPLCNARPPKADKGIALRTLWQRFMNDPE